MNPLRDGLTDEAQADAVDRERLGFDDFTLTDSEVAMRFFELKSSLHGVDRLGRDQTPKARCVWGVVVTAMVVSIVWNILTYVSSFAEFEVKQTFSESQSGIIKYPDLTICNANMLYYSRLDGDPELEALCDDASVTSSEASFLLRNLTNDELQAYGPPLPQFLQDCYVSDQPCNSSAFWQPVVPQSVYWGSTGSCWQLATSDVVAAATGVGADSGVQLVFNVNESDYCAALSPDVGVLVMLHESGTWPNTNNGLMLGPGFSWYIGVQKSTSEAKGAPYGDCTSDADERAVFYESPDTCYAKCVEWRTPQECACRISQSGQVNNDPSVSDLPVCSTAAQLACMDTVSDAWAYSDGSCTCPKDFCKQTSFEVNFATPLRFPSTPARTKVYNVSAEEADDLLKVQVYFDSLTIERMKESPEETFSDLLSKMGGIMGLLLGASVLSVFELCELTFLLGRRRYRRLKQGVGSDVARRKASLVQMGTTESNLDFGANPSPGPETETDPGPGGL